MGLCTALYTCGVDVWWQASGKPWMGDYQVMYRTGAVSSVPHVPGVTQCLEGEVTPRMAIHPVNMACLTVHAQGYGILNIFPADEV